MEPSKNDHREQLILALSHAMTACIFTNFISNTFRKKRHVLRSVRSVHVIVESNNTHFETSRKLNRKKCSTMSCLTFTEFTQITESNNLSCQCLNTNESASEAKVKKKTRCKHCMNRFEYFEFCGFCEFESKYLAPREKTLYATLCAKFTMLDG